VIVARHSLKNPYGEQADSVLEPGLIDLPLSAFTSRELPAFQVPPGQLTENGAQLMRLLGAYQRAHYGSLMQGLSCEEGYAFFADPREPRDVDSAKAFAEGLLLGSPCPAAGVVVNAGADSRRLIRLFRDQPDALDAKTGCGVPGAEALAALLRLGDSEGAAERLRVYKRQLSLIQDLTSCCSQDACKGGQGGLCTIFSLPTALASNVTWRALGGPLGVASAFAEIFAMQYCEGLEAGWGRLREEDMAELLSLLEP
ncbi:unnamed protein product, partial [Polarella glacialis]